MHLTRVEIFGFKSFPKKLDLEFGQGITAIVGPNGCGKTNIVDAIRWCLGEQSLKALRSENMEDVIFNGTKDEKPLSLAEVSLTFSNEKRILPLDYSEVSITRRVFRSGESEYFINKNPCRLKDITDLFLNTGLGADTYSMIEAKMIETVLSDNPSERRNLFEEAAGIAKYRQQKKQTERKLAATEEDLLRLNDIMTELERRLRSLKRQARKARVYDALKKELKELALRLASWENQHFLEEEKRLQGGILAKEEEKRNLSIHIENFEKDLKEMRETLSLNEQRIGERQDELNRLIDGVQKLENEVIVLREREHSLEESIRHNEEEVKSLLSQMTEAEEQNQRLRQQREELKNKLSQIELTLQSKEEELFSLTNEIIDKKIALGECRQKFWENKKCEGEKRETLTLLSARLEEGQRQLETITQEKIHLKEETEERHRTWQAVTALLQTETQELKSLSAEINRIQQELLFQEERLKTLEKTLAELANQIQVTEGEMKVLQGIKERYEGYSEAVRFLVTERKENLVSLAEVLEVEESYRPAIESALGEKLQYLLVENQTQAKQAVELLKKESRGSATFIPLDSFRSQNKKLSLPEDENILGPASQFVQCTHPRYKPMVDEFLSQVVLVKDISKAISIRENTYWCSVNLDGEILTSSGLLSGGRQKKEEVGLLERHHRLESLPKQLEELKQKEEQLAHQTNRLKEIVATLTGQLEERRNSQTLTQETIFKQEKEEGQLALELKILEEKRTLLCSSESKWQNQLSELKEKLQKEQETLVSFTEENQQREQFVVQEEERLKEKERRKEILGEEVNSLKIESAKQKEILESLWREEKSWQKQQKQIFESIEVRRQQSEGSFKLVAELQEKIKQTGLLLQKEQEKKTEYLHQREQLQRESQLLLQRLKEREETVHQKRAILNQIQESLYEYQLALGQIEGKRKNLAERIKEEYELSLEKVGVQYIEPLPPEETSFNPEETKNKVENIKSRIKRLGAVNMVAFEEYQAENQRYEFLSGQRADLLKAKEDLQTTIRKIDETAKTMFLETFSAIRDGFSCVFRQLFEGGETDLRLAGEDPLEAEIEILANPEGKSLRSIALLSGGERALTALALLFGIYLVKPAPFCILDEVDAPLDDANVQRFVSLLKDFREKTQFAIITHNKRTMEVAERLYGVTMEEMGISKVVSVKFD
ncbi:MAG: chromosome segregation protein SMC [Candidatus Edwardsbacteria bacterium]